MKLSAMWCCSNWRKHIFKLEKTETMSPFTKNILTQIIQSIKTEVKCYSTLQLHHTPMRCDHLPSIVFWTPFCLDFSRPPRCAVVSGTKTFATDPLNPLWRLVHPTDARFDWGRGNLEARSRSQTCCCAPQTIYEPFWFCGRTRYLTERDPSR